MAREAPKVPSHQGGFSLIETLVALSLLSLVMALIPHAISAGKHALRRAVAIGGFVPGSSMRYLEQRLSDALPLYRARVGNSAQVYFVGEPQRMVFLSAIGNGSFGGGLYRVELSAVEGGSGLRKLMVGFYPYSPANAISAPVVDSRVLAAGLSRASFRYFGPLENGAASVWQDTWVNRNRLPAAVELKFSEAGRPETSLRVPLRLGSAIGGVKQ